MAREEEVRGVSVRNSQTGKARIVPLVSLWILECYELLHYEVSSQIEEEVG